MLKTYTARPRTTPIIIPTFRSAYIPKNLREIVKDRDGRTCEYCGKKLCIQPRDSNIDHRVARANGGKTTLDNLHLLCPSCNSIKWTREIEDHTQFTW